MDQWDADLHKRVAGTIKRMRGPRSAQWLADRTSELGYPISRAQIANYESGRKKGLDLAEFLVIAAALNTSPVTLLYPGPYDASVEMLPSNEQTELTAAEWFSAAHHPVVWRNIHPSAGTDVVAQKAREESLEWVENTIRLRLWRELVEAQMMRNRVMARAEFDRDRQQIAFYDSQIQRLTQELGLPNDG